MVLGDSQLQPQASCGTAEEARRQQLGASQAEGLWLEAEGKEDQALRGTVTHSTRVGEGDGRKKKKII